MKIMLDFYFFIFLFFSLSPYNRTLVACYFVRLLSVSILPFEAGIGIFIMYLA